MNEHAQILDFTRNTYRAPEVHPQGRLLRRYLRDAQALSVRTYQAGALTWAMVGGGILTVAIALIAR